MNQSALCIQGPPGSGKTSKGGQVIAELLKAGKRVGISSNTHDAICELMRSAVEAATKLDIHFTAAKCGESEEDRVPFHPSIEIIPENAGVFQRETLPDLVGGTAWLFSRAEAQGQFDYLFIDEAGQVSLAKLVAMAQSASNFILLGDQMQLSQPIRGVHPGESGKSILDYYLQDHATVPDAFGIFLPKTWRMRPEICSFISNAVYDGRLKHELCTETRSIRLSKAATYLHRSAGLLYVPVEHEGNTYESDEEVEVVHKLVAELIGQTLEQAGQPPRALSADDILVVAPFNLQVRKLKTALPGIHVGTVDKFQGQQAPVVIFSMTASDGDASPRGMEFLFDKNRLNVAVSRAQILAVIVASPKLERTRCVRLQQMPPRKVAACMNDRSRISFNCCLCDWIFVRGSRNQEIMSTLTVTPISIEAADQELNQAILTGKALEAFETYYAENVVMQENTDEPFAGKDLNRKREIEFFSSISEFHSGKLLGSAVNGNRSYAEFESEMTFKNGHRAKMTQVAVRQWENGKIVHERFYYKG